VGAANCKSSTSQIDFELLFGSFLLVFETYPCSFMYCNIDFRYLHLAKPFPF
jgi:hypothetical protein